MKHFIYNTKTTITTIKHRLMVARGEGRGKVGPGGVGRGQGWVAGCGRV